MGSISEFSRVTFGFRSKIYAHNTQPTRSVLYDGETEMEMCACKYLHEVHDVDN